MSILNTPQKTRKDKKSATNKGKAKKRKTSRHIAKPRRGVKIRSNNPRRNSKAKTTPKPYLYIKTKPGKQKTTKLKFMADRAKNCTLSVPSQHTTKNAKGKKAKRNQQKRKGEKRVATSLNPGGEVKFGSNDKKRNNKALAAKATPKPISLSGQSRAKQKRQ